MWQKTSHAHFSITVVFWALSLGVLRVFGTVVVVRLKQHMRAARLLCDRSIVHWKEVLQVNNVLPGG